MRFKLQERSYDIHGDNIREFRYYLNDKTKITQILYVPMWPQQCQIRYATSFISDGDHPLGAVYSLLCKGDRMQIAKTDEDSRKIALVLFASLVLL